MATSRIGGTGRKAVRMACLAVLAAALCPRPAAADSYLLAVEESLNGKPSPLPLPVKEGLFDSLFEAGHVVFDTRDGAPLPPFQDLVLLARDGGARLVLRVSVVSREETGPEKRRTVTSAATYELYEARTGRLMGRGKVTEGNAGREAACDGRQLGMEIGRKIIRETGPLAVAAKAP